MYVTLAPQTTTQTDYGVIHHIPFPPSADYALHVTNIYVVIVHALKDYNTVVFLCLTICLSRSCGSPETAGNRQQPSTCYTKKQRQRQYGIEQSGGSVVMMCFCFCPRS